MHLGDSPYYVASAHTPGRHHNGFDMLFQNATGPLYCPNMWKTFKNTTANVDKTKAKPHKTTCIVLTKQHERSYNVKEWK